MHATAGFHLLTLVLPPPPPQSQINYSLGLLLETRSEDIYRMKGLLSIHGSQYRYVYQVRGGQGGAQRGGVGHTGGMGRRRPAFARCNERGPRKRLERCVWKGTQRGLCFVRCVCARLNLRWCVVLGALGGRARSQGVHSIFEGVPDREWRADEKRQCKMVFIGRELDKEAFKEAFEHCLVSALCPLRRVGLGGSRGQGGV